jgi:hypothetical protein
MQVSQSNAPSKGRRKMSAAVNDRNAKISAQEVEAFKTDEPGPYFAYVPASNFVRGAKVETWTGDELATITEVGQRWTSNMGDVRIPFRAVGINGVTYSGTAFRTAGDYVRMRPVKA